jgi:hypothetical protein
VFGTFISLPERVFGCSSFNVAFFCFSGVAAFYVFVQRRVRFNGRIFVSQTSEMFTFAGPFFIRLNT